MKSFTSITLFIILIVLLILYRIIESNRLGEETQDNIDTIQKYLFNDTDLTNSKKPILWLHVPHEYNSRNWLSFGSRSTFNLNQEYLYLTVKSIIHKCDKSFTICLINDQSFNKLLPNWSIDMDNISSPISDKIRTLGLMKLLYNYGGLICPISFLCIQDLKLLYDTGTNGHKMFLCEFVNTNITSTETFFYPNLLFSGAPKKSPTVLNLIDFIQRTISTDFTDESTFLGEFNRWCERKISSQEINLIDGMYIGTKTTDNKRILVDNLLQQNYLNLYPKLYGIYIPSDEILKRKYYEWFARLSAKQVLESNTIIGNYILITLANEDKSSILEPIVVRPNNWVGFWKVPSGAPLWSIKPNFLGDNIPMLPYPER